MTHSRNGGTVPPHADLEREGVMRYNVYTQHMTILRQHIWQQPHECRYL